MQSCHSIAGLPTTFLRRPDQGDTAGAGREFERAADMKSNGRANIAGVLALAALAFAQARYAHALALYQRALREHPGAPPEVRLGIAACLFRWAPLQFPTM